MCNNHHQCIKNILLAFLIVKNELWIEDILNNNTITQMEVYDLSGHRLSLQNGDHRSINVSDLGNGTYLLRIYTIEGVYTHKFTVVR